jgi:hypothetical protein
MAEEENEWRGKEKQHELNQRSYMPSSSPGELTAADVDGNSLSPVYSSSSERSSISKLTISTVSARRPPVHLPRAYGMIFQPSAPNIFKRTVNRGLSLRKIFSDRRAKRQVLVQICNAICTNLLVKANVHPVSMMSGIKSL